MRKSPVVLGVASIESECWRQHSPVFLNQGGREFDDLRPGLLKAAMLDKDRTGFFVTYQQADVLKDLQGGGMRAFNLRLC